MKITNLFNITNGCKFYFNTFYYLVVNLSRSRGVDEGFVRKSLFKDWNGILAVGFTMRVISANFKYNHFTYSSSEEI